MELLKINRHARAEKTKSGKSMKIFAIAQFVRKISPFCGKFFEGRGEKVSISSQSKKDYFPSNLILIRNS
jgi:hypothetical protein